MALARIDEKASDGSFRAIHRLGDPFDANHEPIVDPQLTGMLGAYWGCQDICARWQRKHGVRPLRKCRGATFLRGMARCKIRKSFFDFCRVCADRLTTAIVDSSS